MKNLNVTHTYIRIHKIPTELCEIEFKKKHPKAYVETAKLSLL